MRIIRKTIPIAIAIVLLLLPITGYAATGDTIVHKTRTGDCYHMDGCPSLKSDIEITLQEAMDEGLSPCKRCNPPVIEGYVPTRKPQKSYPNNYYDNNTYYHVHEYVQSIHARSLWDDYHAKMEDIEHPYINVFLILLALVIIAPMIFDILTIFIFEPMLNFVSKKWRIEVVYDLERLSDKLCPQCKVELDKKTNKCPQCGKRHIETRPLCSIIFISLTILFFITTAHFYLQYKNTSDALSYYKDALNQEFEDRFSGTINPINNKPITTAQEFLEAMDAYMYENNSEY